MAHPLPGTDTRQATADRVVLRTLRGDGPQTLLGLCTLIDEWPAGDVNASLRRLRERGFVYVEDGTGLPLSAPRWHAYPRTARQGRLIG